MDGQLTTITKIQESLCLKFSAVDEAKITFLQVHKKNVLYPALCFHLVENIMNELMWLEILQSQEENHSAYWDSESTVRGEMVISA